MSALPRIASLLPGEKRKPMSSSVLLQICLILSLYAKERRTAPPPPLAQPSSLLALLPREQRGTSRFVWENYKPQEAAHQERRSGQAAAKLQVP